MITLQDCIAMCGLDEAEVLAIAELSREHGAATICSMLRDDIGDALRRKDRGHARDLFMALRHFLSTHTLGECATPSPDVRSLRS